MLCHWFPVTEMGAGIRKPEQAGPDRGYCQRRSVYLTDPLHLLPPGASVSTWGEELGTQEVIVISVVGRQDAACILRLI